ncbi:MAG: OadG family transporter subunit [Dehalococcoidia bacterium]
MTLIGLLITFCLLFLLIIFIELIRIANKVIAKFLSAGDPEENKKKAFAATIASAAYLSEENN